MHLLCDYPYRTVFLIFEITNFLIRLWTFEIQDLNDILLTHANFGTYETILPFIRSAWNLPCIFFATLPRTAFWIFFIFPVFLLGFRLLKSRTWTIFYSPMPTLVHSKSYFHSFGLLETYHATSLRLSLWLFIWKFPVFWLGFRLFKFRT